VWPNKNIPWAYSSAYAPWWDDSPGNKYTCTVILFTYLMDSTISKFASRCYCCCCYYYCL